MTRYRHPSAFSLVELLIVIAIIGVLLLLTLAAVQQTRGAAARLSCSNNLKQMGLALQNYHDAQGALPPGLRRGPDPYPFLSWSARLLPYLEQQPLWERTEAAFAQAPYFGQVPPHIGLGTVLPVFICPGDGRTSAVIEPENLAVALTDYLGVSGTNSGAGDGLLFLNSRYRFADITDGTSNTLVVGERPPGPDTTGQLRFGWWYAGMGQKLDGSADSVLGVREINISTKLSACPPGPYHFGPGRQDNPCDLLHYWSLHSGGANFLCADGSVHFLSYSADAVLPALSTRAGNEVFDSPF